ncbi:hypothetical protein GCM10010294_52070 [Streptomyces griseoloalbus]|nr:hypothetical protein GCM10010294_52070 [Streptomyces griseoloalbus]
MNAPPHGAVPQESCSSSTASQAAVSGFQRRVVPRASSAAASRRFAPRGVRIASVPLQLEAALQEKLRLDQPDGSGGGDVMGPPMEIIGFIGAAGLVEGLAQYGQGPRFPGGVVPLAGPGDRLPSDIDVERGVRRPFPCPHERPPPVPARQAQRTRCPLPPLLFQQPEAKPSRPRPAAQGRVFSTRAFFTQRVRTRTFRAVASPRHHVFRVPAGHGTKAAPATVAAVHEGLNHQWKATPP